LAAGEGIRTSHEHPVQGVDLEREGQGRAGAAGDLCRR
jgi:hypothetical protein